MAELLCAGRLEAHSNLTLNFGLRYEYFSPPVQRGKATNFDLNGFVPARQTFHGFPDIPDTPDRPAALGVSGQERLRAAVRFRLFHAMDSGFRAAWRLWHVLHARDHEFVDDADPESTYRADLCLYRERHQSDQRRNRIWQAPVRRALGLFGSGALDPNLRTTYTQQWNLTAQKRLPKDIYFDVGYVGSKGTRLDRHLRWQPPDPDRHAGTGSRAHRYPAAVSRV